MGNIYYCLGPVDNSLIDASAGSRHNRNVCGAGAGDVERYGYQPGCGIGRHLHGQTSVRILTDIDVVIDNRLDDRFYRSDVARLVVGEVISRLCGKHSRKCEQ